MKPIGEPLTPAQLDDQERMALRTARSIGVALILGVVLFLAVMTMVTRSAQRSAPAGRQPDPLFLWMAIGFLVVGASTAIVMRTVLRRRLADSRTGRLPVQAFVTTSLITLALLEAPALFAALAGMMMGSMIPVGGISLLAVAMMIAFFPRASQFSTRKSGGASDQVYGYREPEKWQ